MKTLNLVLFSSQQHCDYDEDNHVLVPFQEVLAALPCLESLGVAEIDADMLAYCPNLRHLQCSQLVSGRFLDLLENLTSLESLKHSLQPDETLRALLQNNHHSTQLDLSSGAHTEDTPNLLTKALTANRWLQRLSLQASLDIISVLAQVLTEDRCSLTEISLNGIVSDTSELIRALPPSSTLTGLALNYNECRDHDVWWTPLTETLPTLTRLQRLAVHIPSSHHPKLDVDDVAVALSRNRSLVNVHMNIMPVSPERDFVCRTISRRNQVLSLVQDAEMTDALMPPIVDSLGRNYASVTYLLVRHLVLADAFQRVRFDRPENFRVSLP